MTVEQVWEYGKERGTELFSISRGSAYSLANGNILGTYSEIARDASGSPTLNAVDDGPLISKIVEVNPTTSEIASEYTIHGKITYRLFRAGLYDGYSERRIRSDIS
jgi:hypothetical protein